MPDGDTVITLPSASTNEHRWRNFLSSQAPQNTLRKTNTLSGIADAKHTPFLPRRFLVDFSVLP